MLRTGTDGIQNGKSNDPAKHRAIAFLAGSRLNRARNDLSGMLAELGCYPADGMTRLVENGAGDIAERIAKGKREGLAVRLAAMFGGNADAALTIARVAAAVLRTKFRKPVENTGAVIAERLERLTCEVHTEKAMVRIIGGWSGYDLHAITEVFQGKRKPPAGSTWVPIAKDYSKHPAVRQVKSYCIGAAQAGDWRGLYRRLGETLVRDELRIDMRQVAEWSGVAENVITEGLRQAAEKMRMTA